MQYTYRLKRAIINEGIALAYTEAPVLDMARQLSKQHNRKSGAIYDRLLNVIYLETNGQRGRQDQWSTAWVRKYYDRRIKEVRK